MEFNEKFRFFQVLQERWSGTTEFTYRILFDALRMLSRARISRCLRLKKKLWSMVCSITFASQSSGKYARCAKDTRKKLHEERVLCAYQLNANYSFSLNWVIQKFSHQYAQFNSFYMIIIFLKFILRDSLNFFFFLHRLIEKLFSSLNLLQ